MEQPSEECSGLGLDREHQVADAVLTDHEVAAHEHLAAEPGQKDHVAAVASMKNLECNWN